MDARCDIAVVGGGASGLTAAIAAAWFARHLGLSLRVVVLESDERVGRSILKTGNGRCNFSNEGIAGGSLLREYRNPAFVRAVLESLAMQCAAAGSLAEDKGNAGKYGVQARGSGNADRASEFADKPLFAHGRDPVCSFFETLGLAWRAESDGRLYPLANKASVVLDVLRAEAARLGVEELCASPVESVEMPRTARGPFTLRLADGVLWRANQLVVACGGSAIGRLRLEGQEVLKPRPLLGPLRVSAADQALTRELDNIRVRCRVSLLRKDASTSLRRPQESCMHSDEGSAGLAFVAGESGELLFRSYGVSGICVFNLSRLAQPGDLMQIDFLGLGDSDEGRGWLENRVALLADHASAYPDYGSSLRGLVLPRVADVLMKAAGVSANAPTDFDVLFDMLCRCRLEVAGTGPADQCQIHRGGLAVDGFAADSLESRTQPGLFACGEALDVDGPCGGYNLHWAWASGLVAGHAIAARACGNAGDGRMQPC